MTTASPVVVGPSRLGGDGGGRRGGADRLPQLLVSRAQRRRDLGDERLGLVGGDRALLDEPGRIHGAHGRLPLDPLDHQRLGVRRVVLLVVAEAPVADEVDHEVVAELRPVRERQPHGRQRRLGIVGVDVHDRHVESLGQVARVAGRAALGRIGRVADLVVRDQVERAARRVALQRLQVQRLGDDALPRERRIAVNQDGQRDGRIVDAGTDGAVGLLGPGTALDDRVGRLEVARIGDDRDVDLAGRRDPRARRRQVVLDVSRAALGIDDEGVERALAFELAQDRLIGAPDGVHERVEPAAVGHADHDLVRAPCGGEPDRLVEHRHERLETLERELLLPEERPPQVLLEALGLGEPVQERLPLRRVERLPEAPRLDRLPEPDALGVVGDVLDLVGDRARVDGAEERERLEQRVPFDVETEQGGRDARLQLGRQGRDEAGLVERRVAHRLGAERVEPGCQVPVHAVGLDEGHGSCDAAEQVLVDRGGCRPRVPVRARRRPGRPRRRALPARRRRRRHGDGLGRRRSGGGRSGSRSGRLAVGAGASPAQAVEPPFVPSCCMRPASPGSEPANAAGSRSNRSRHSCDTLAGASR